MMLLMLTMLILYSYWYIDNIEIISYYLNVDIRQVTNLGTYYCSF